MLKRIYIRKIIITTLALLIVAILYLMPSKTMDYEIKDTTLEYVYSNTEEIIYLLDTNNYVARTTIKGDNLNTEEKALDVIKGLIIDGEKSSIIPNGFRPILPIDTEVLGLTLENKILTINFSKELCNINEEYEEKMISSIIYTLTSINGIDKIIIKVEGEDLTKLPNSGKSLSMPLDRSFGINKKYDITTLQDIEKYTIYYVSKVNDTPYYVPVTKYINNTNGDKIKIIVDELSTSPIYETNLMSYLDTNIVLKDYTIENEQLKLNFNDAILSDNNHILEEVIYTISLSMEDNYNVKEVIFMVDNEEIEKVEK